jgi:hypothetical protein
MDRVRSEPDAKADVRDFDVPKVAGCEVQSLDLGWGLEGVGHAMVKSLATNRLSNRPHGATGLHHQTGSSPCQGSLARLSSSLSNALTLAPNTVSKDPLHSLTKQYVKGIRASNHGSNSESINIRQPS